MLIPLKKKKITSSICMARRATSIGNTVSVLVNTIWYLV